MALPGTVVVDGESVAIVRKHFAIRRSSDVCTSLQSRICDAKVAPFREHR